MTLLDTNVISEPLRPAGNPHTLAWLDAQVLETLFLSTVSLAELRFGIAVLPAGRRKETLHSSLEQRVLPLFAGRILPFDEVASQHYAALLARARAAGRSIAVADGYIAAIAAAHGMAVATRDTAPFEALGLPVVNPFVPTG